MRNFIPVFAVLALTGQALASSSAFSPVASVSFTNKISVDALNDPDNALDTWVSTGGGSVSAIRVTGSLTEAATATGTFANEARVQISAGAGQAFAAFGYQASTVGNYTGTLAIGPTVVPVTSFTLNNAGTVNFQWFESVQDGAANIAEQTWNSVTYEFGSNVITNGNTNLGALTPNGLTVSTAGSHVAGGLDFYTLTVPYGVNLPLDYLNISMVAGAAPSMTDPEIALYDGAGNLVDTNDDGGVGLFSELTYGAADPLAAPDSVPGFDGLTLAAGNYTLVTGGFNTVFGATINAITPGTNAGSYRLDVTYVPEPTALVLLALGGVALLRRR